MARTPTRELKEGLVARINVLTMRNSRSSCLVPSVLGGRSKKWSTHMERLTEFEQKILDLLRALNTQQKKDILRILQALQCSLRG